MERAFSREFCTSLFRYRKQQPGTYQISTVTTLLRVGIIGLGHMGLLHLRNTKFLRDVKVVAAADKSRRGLSEAKDYGIKNVYEDYNDLLKLADLDAVVICLPNFLHEESVIRSAERGVDIFVEKPLARNVQECKNIEREVKKHDVKLHVGANYRYFDHVQKLKKEYDKGSIGEVQIANFEHFVNGPFAHPLNPVPIADWWLDRDLVGGGVLLDQGYHMVDLFKWFFPDPELKYASLGNRFNLDVEDSAVIMLESKHTSTTGIISVGWFQKMVFPQFNFRINLHGTTRFLSSDHFQPSNLYLHAAKEAFKNISRRAVGRRIRPLSYTYYYASYYEQMKEFVESVEHDKNPNILGTVEDGLEIVSLVQQAYELSSYE